MFSSDILRLFCLMCKVKGDVSDYYFVGLSTYNVEKMTIWNQLRVGVYKTYFTWDISLSGDENVCRGWSLSDRKILEISRKTSLVWSVLHGRPF